jgi:threonine aldolase
MSESKKGASKVVDLRSDTVTKPTDEMRRAMAEAEVGDDVFGEDPTINRLQERVAAMFGAEAALFVATGSMGNLVSLRSMTEPGDEVICHEFAHFLLYEVGSLSAVAGVQAKALAGRRGVLDPNLVADSVNPRTYTFPRTAVVAVENTHNVAGGAIYPIDELRQLRKVADEHDLCLYLDGARIFNASIASGVPVSDYFAEVDALSFCFSKGLGAPVGSMVVGSQDFIARAHRYRKMHGGGMRQVGILGAAAQVAIDSMVDRLADDHANAKRLAEGISELSEDAVAMIEVETNIVLVRTKALGFEPVELVEALAGRGVKFLPYRPGVVRMMTHKDVSADDIEFTLEQLRKVVRP